MRSIVKITAEKLNQIDLSEQAGKIAGGCMLVTDAAELTKESVEKLKISDGARKTKKSRCHVSRTI